MAQHLGTDAAPAGTARHDDVLRLSPEVADALSSARPVVALESTLISHGLPRPRNHQVAAELEEIVRTHGACPATIAVLDGVPHIGLTEHELERVALGTSFTKLGMRDLPMAIAAKANGGTTVSATAFLAARVGIRVFATGGLGGVHRGWIDSWDESADLDLLSRTRITIVSAGVKSILDVPATLQRLETLNVMVVGYRTLDFPGFYLRESGEKVDWSVESPDEIAQLMRNQDTLDLASTLLVANPVSLDDELDRNLHDRVLAEALAAADRDAVRGKQLTPYLLGQMFEGTDGASLEANVSAIRGNTDLAARISRAWTELTPTAQAVEV